MIGGVLIGKGSFRKFDDYDLTIKVKDFNVNKEAKFYNLIFTSFIAENTVIMKFSILLTPNNGYLLEKYQNDMVELLNPV